MQELAVRFESFGVSHQGRVRERNEDRFLIEPESGLWVVADGMGGHEDGELASSSIVEHLGAIGVAASAPELRERFEDRLARAHGDIRRQASERGVTIGSTVAALLAIDGCYACLWAGDSRIYLVRAGTIAQVSRDHTEAQELVERGVITPQEAQTWPRRNVITRAIGVSDDLVMEFEQGETLPGDIFVLCTDGLTNHVSDREIESAVVAAPPRQACQALLDMVLERGASDNVTIVVARCRAAPGDEAGTRPPVGGRETTRHEL